MLDNENKTPADGIDNGSPSDNLPPRRRRRAASRPATASRVFRPSPVLRTTVVSAGSSRPFSMSFF
ncbi:hypothetical protein, partial [Streptomyces sp. NPDC004050]